MELLGVPSVRDVCCMIELRTLGELELIGSDRWYGTYGGTVAKELRCGDVMPGCTFVASGATEEEVLKKAAQHARDKHNVKELTADLVGKVKAAIRTT